MKAQTLSRPFTGCRTFFTNRRGFGPSGGRVLGACGGSEFFSPDFFWGDLLPGPFVSWTSLAGGDPPFGQGDSQGRVGHPGLGGGGCCFCDRLHGGGVRLRGKSPVTPSDSFLPSGWGGWWQEGWVWDKSCGWGGLVWWGASGVSGFLSGV